MNDDFDYTSSGFDNFLSRSIDNLRQTNLDAQGPVSTQIRYDSSQLSGSISDALKTDEISINNEDGIEVLNGLLHVQDEKGRDVLVGGNPFIKVITGKRTVGLSEVNDFFSGFSFPHYLQHVPIVTGRFWVTDPTVMNSLPFGRGGIGGGLATPGCRIAVDSVDALSINCSIRVYDLGGLAVILPWYQQNLNFEFYCSTAPDQAT